MISFFSFWRALFSLSFCRLYIGGSSKSSSSNTTNNQDNRVAVSAGVGLSNSNRNTINVTDGGIVSRALDSVDMSSANLGAGYQSLIDAADSLFQRGESMIGQTQQHVADAYRNAESDKGGALDQKTIIILAAVGVVGLFAFKRA